MKKSWSYENFFTKVKEELEFIPAKHTVIDIWQEKAVFEGNDGEKIIEVPRSVHPLGKCSASTSLLAYIITSKYADGLPLYRLDNMLTRLGHEIGRINMANWIISLDEIFKPLINLAREIQNSGNYIQANETRMHVLKENGKTAQSDIRMCVTRGGPPGQLTVLFKYAPSRAGRVSSRLLDGFDGVLQADGYSGYAANCQERGIDRIGYWDHARRRFGEEQRAEKPSKGKKSKAKTPSTADVALGKIGKLYAIESKIADLSSDEKYKVRQDLSVPLLDDLKAWLEGKVTKLANGLAKDAVRYTLNQWGSLVGYTRSGEVHISNVLAEIAIRPFAVGRKAWLFADSAVGARASVTCYSLIETERQMG